MRYRKGLAGLFADETYGALAAAILVVATSGYGARPSDAKIWR